MIRRVCWLVGWFVRLLRSFRFIKKYKSSFHEWPPDHKSKTVLTSETSQLKVRVQNRGNCSAVISDIPVFPRLLESPGKSLWS